MLLIRPLGVEPRIAGYKPGATNRITLGARISDNLKIITYLFIIYILYQKFFKISIYLLEAQIN